MGELTARLRAALDTIRRALRRRRVDLQGADPYHWRRILRRARLGSSVKLVGYVLADYASPDGCDIRPGNDRIAAEAELSDKSVRRAMNTLRSIGLIERTFAGSKMGRRALADEYRLTIPADLGERVPLLDPEKLEVSPVTLTGDPVDSPVGNPVDNPGTPVTGTGDQVPPDPGTPVTGDGTPVTESRNTGHSDRPPNQPPNHKTTTNKPRGFGGHLAEVEGPPILVSAIERDDLESGDERQRYAKASAILRRLPDLGAQFMEQAKAELPEARLVETVIRAAQICVTGIPA